MKKEASIGEGRQGREGSKSVESKPYTNTGSQLVMVGHVISMTISATQINTACRVDIEQLR